VSADHSTKASVISPVEGFVDFIGIAQSPLSFRSPRWGRPGIAVSALSAEAFGSSLYIQHSLLCFSGKVDGVVVQYVLTNQQYPFLNPSGTGETIHATSRT
jgi:hypothetical protein